MTWEELKKHVGHFVLVVDAYGMWNIYRLNGFLRLIDPVAILVKTAVSDRNCTPECVKVNSEINQLVCPAENIRKIASDKTAVRALIEQLNDMERELVLARDRFRVAIELI